MKRRPVLKCPECEGAALDLNVTALTGKVRGESFTVNSQALVCPRCKFKTVPRENMAEFSLRIADAYREKHNLLTSSDIKDRRANLGMTQEQFANYLGVGVASVRRWELGQIQDEAMDTLMVLKTDLRAAEENLAEVSARLGQPFWANNNWGAFWTRGNAGSLFTVLWEPKDRPNFMPVSTRIRSAELNEAEGSTSDRLREIEEIAGTMQMEMVA